MLTRLLVVAAALAALFVFAPTASAGESGDSLSLPSECLNINTDNDTIPEDCLAALRGLTNLEGLPESCRELTDVFDLLDDPANVTGGLIKLSGDQLGGVLDCINDLVDLGEGETEEPGETEETDDEPYDGYAGIGYGGDLGDIPEGGVDSGIGPTGSDEPGAPLAARGAALLALLGVLGTGLTVMRRRRQPGT